MQIKADQVTFMRQTQAVLENIVNVKIPPNMGTSMLKPDVPCENRDRGCCGDVSALYNANEASVQGNMHTHSLLYTRVDWKFIETIAQYPLLNNKLGSFLDSIISSELTYKRSHDLQPKPVFPNPTVVHLNTSSVPYPTVSVLPYPTQVLETICEDEEAMEICSSVEDTMETSSVVLMGGTSSSGEEKETRSSEE